jgi:hypothetical protein
MDESPRIKGWRCGVHVFEDFTDHEVERKAVHLYKVYKGEDPHKDILTRADGISTPTTSSLETFPVQKEGWRITTRDVFTGSYDSLRRMAQSLLWSITPLRDQPDHVGEALLVSWEALEKWDCRSTFTTYAYKVMKNHLYQLNKRGSVKDRSYSELVFLDGLSTNR